MSDHIEEAIEKNATGPASVTIENKTVAAKDVQQQIDADRHLANKAAAKHRHLGLRFLSMSPPGGG